MQLLANTRKLNTLTKHKESTSTIELCDTRVANILLYVRIGTEDFRMVEGVAESEQGVKVYTSSF